MKFKVPWPLLPNILIQYLTPLYQLLTKIIISNVSWQNMSSLQIAVLEKYQRQQYLLIYGINDDK